MARKAKARKSSRKVTPARQDDEIRAADIRARLGLKLQEVCLIMDEAKLAGLVVSFNLRPTPDNARMLVDGININRML